MASILLLPEILQLLRFFRMTISDNLTERDFYLLIHFVNLTLQYKADTLISG